MSSTTPAPAATPATPPPSTLHTRILNAARSSDPSLAKASRILSSASTLDLNLMTAQYSLTFLAESIKFIHNKAALARLFARLSALSTYFDSVTIVSKPGDILLPPSQTALRLRRLTALISDVRIFNRLWGTITMLKWGSAVLQAPPKDAILKLIAYTQVVSNNIYQPLENIAYLASHDILPVDKLTVKKLWIFSSRLWALHIILEFVRLAREYALSSKSSASATTSEKLDPELAAERVKAKKLWTRQLIVTAAYFPLTIHWSLESGIINDWMVGLFGSIAGGVRFFPLWREG
ncbi:hypothetical protein BZA70DRAFT_84041 [Myxozyma melibiosi]|uniref:Peroxin 11C n=1 Tax=Myxozyma melibiosi TaxID=54550 RepID=A0ABR1F051_9ASCO